MTNIIDVKAKTRRDGKLTTYTVTTDDGRVNWYEYPHNIGNPDAEPARRWLEARKREAQAIAEAESVLRSLRARAAWRRRNPTAPLHNGLTDAAIFAHEVSP